ncbi:MAG: TRAP transporter small permease [Clostridiaceae bacterium]|nr:TRAP transporter small permease [Clostridiaceae bacterium]
MKRIEDFFLWHSLISLQRFVLAVCSIGSVLLITASVIMRYILKTDLYGLEEIILVAAMWMYFIGGSYGSYDHSHIAAEILPVFIKSPKKIYIIYVIIAVISLIISLAFAVWGIQYYQLVYKLGGQSASLHIPHRFSRICLPISFFLMVVYNIYHLVCLILSRKPIIVGENGGLAE